MKNLNLYIALVHHPVLNKFGEIVTTSITNLDIHDIARSAITYDVTKYYLINPLESQKLFVDRVLKFWNSNIAKKYNNDRVNALSVVDYAYSLENCIQKIKKQEKSHPIVITTTANEMKGQVDFDFIAKIDEKRTILLLFGTGNGLTDEIHSRADFILKPIKGLGNFNHLSVRSAVAIILDRLTSEK